MLNISDGLWRETALLTKADPDHLHAYESLDESLDESSRAC